MTRRTKTAALLISSLLLLLMTTATPPQTTIQQPTQATTGQKNNSNNSITRENSPLTSTYWARTYEEWETFDEGNFYAYGSAKTIQQTSDGGYIVAGTTESLSSSGYNVWVLKLNSVGSVTWQKCFQDCIFNEVGSIEQTLDGGYIVAGATGGGLGYVGACVLKLNATGSLTWAGTYDDPGTCQGAFSSPFQWYARSVEQTSDGGYIVAGHISFDCTLENLEYKGDDSVLLLFKLSSLGRLQWAETCNATGGSYAESVQQTTDGGYLVAGCTNSSGAGGYDAWVLKFNSTGGLTWQKTYGGSGDDYANYAQQTTDGDYLVAGCTDSFGAGSDDIWVLKLDSTGSVQWQKTYGGSGYDVANSVQQTSDGGYIVAGATDSFGAGGDDFWVLKLNSAGGVTWQKTYGGSGHDVANSIQQTSDGGYIEAGYTDSFGFGYGSFWVLKLSSTGSVVWNEGSGASTQTTSVSPVDSNAQVSTTFTTLATPSTEWYSWYGEEKDTNVTIVTQGGSNLIPPATISDLAAYSLTWHSVTLTWTAPGEDDVIGNATGYLVKYSTTGEITDANWASATEYNQSWTPNPGGSTETHVVSGLMNATRYWFAVEAYDEALNYGGVSNSPNAATLDAFLPGTITDLRVVNATETTVTLSWTAPGDNGTLGTATGYVVKYSTNGPINASNWDSATTYNQTWVPLSAGNTETHVVTGLMNATRYWFAVVAYDQAFNYGRVSNSPSARTDSSSATSMTGKEDLALLLFAVGIVVGVPVTMVEVALYKSRRK